jgi:hypothetical protein
VNPCKRTGCQNPVKNRQMVYCSRDCAPLGRYGDEVTRSGPTARSTIKVGGVASPGFLNAELRLEAASVNDIQISHLRTKSAEEEKRITMPIVNENAAENETSIGASQMISADDGQLDGWRTAPQTSPTEKKSSSGTPEETRLMDFIAPSPGSSAESYLSGNLIDSTLGQLHDLMKSVAADNPRARNNPESINAVCNVAKQMRELMVLKLNVVKTARKLESI